MTSSARSIGERRATLAVEVRREIERMIVDGDLASGEKLNELSLSSAMGVSRGTVREAIRSLADSGLIDLIANRGAFVHETSLTEVRNLYDLRGTIFAMVCATAAGRVADGKEPKLMNRLQKNLDRMSKTQKEGDKRAYYMRNIEFHDMLLDAAANPRAKTIYDNLVKEMHLFRKPGPSTATNFARLLEEHRAISDAVTAGDPEGARTAAQNHITSAFSRYMQMVEQKDDVADERTNSQG